MKTIGCKSKDFFNGYNHYDRDDQMVDNYKNKKNALDGALYVQIFEDVMFAWHGGYIINIYSLDDFMNVDCITCELKSLNDVEDVKDVINSRISDWENE